MLAVAALFRVGPADARAVLTDVTRACAQWEAVAQHNGLSRHELTAMAPAFVHEQVEQARAVIAS